MISRRRSHCTDLEAFPRRRLRNRQAIIALSPECRHATLKAQDAIVVPSISITPPSPAPLLPSNTRGQCINRHLLHPPHALRRRHHRSHRIWIRRVDGTRVLAGCTWRDRRNAISGKAGKQEPGQSPRSRILEALRLGGRTVRWVIDA